MYDSIFTVASVMLQHSGLKFTDMLLFAVCVFACIQTCSIGEGSSSSAMYWCVLSRKVF